jgi:hypothetical protein
VSWRAALLAPVVSLAGCAGSVTSFDSTGRVDGLEALEEVTVAWNPIGPRRIAGYTTVAQDMEPFEKHDRAFESAFREKFPALLASHGVRVVPPREGMRVLLVGVTHRDKGCRVSCGTFITYGGMLFRDPARPQWTFVAEQKADPTNPAALDNLFEDIVDALADDGLLAR